MVKRRFLEEEDWNGRSHVDNGRTDLVSGEHALLGTFLRFANGIWYILDISSPPAFPCILLVFACTHKQNKGNVPFTGL